MRATGALFGLAYGDAMGAPTEFLSMAQITAIPTDIGTGRVTDDTQMMLAVADAVTAVEPLEPERFANALRGRFLAWAQFVEPFRAPGNTCLRACANLTQDIPWQDATVIASKGCGANMRVAPLGLVPDVPEKEWAAAAQLQAAITHGHPAGLAASELTAYAIRLLRDGGEPADLPGALRERANAQRTVYREDWLGDLWRRSTHDTPEKYISEGWDDCLDVLDRLDIAVRLGDRTADPCAITGEAWVADEALATSVLCFLLFPDDPVAAIGRAAASSGDSDSIACLTGAYAGARHGMAGWPAGWADRIEYAEELRRYGATWDA